ncbi:MAG TPA: hypothetical protein VF329_13330 [Gammaproteobacteria bacterium]
MTRSNEETTTLKATLIGIGLAILQLVQIALLVLLWPTGRIAVEHALLDTGRTLLILAALSGGIGANATLMLLFISLTTRKELYTHRVWWFGLPIVIGISAGTVAYIVIRAGILKLDAPMAAEALNPFTVCAISVIAGTSWNRIFELLQQLGARQIPRD